MTMTCRAQRRDARDGARLAAWACAVVLACGWVAAARPAAAAPGHAPAESSITAAHPGSHQGGGLLFVPAMAETENSVDDGDLREPSSDARPGNSVGRHSSGRPGGAGSSAFVADRSILGTTSADLIRLCRLLL